MAVTSKPILVTGAAGFVASRIIEQLLSKGYFVRGTVRSMKKDKELSPLRELPGAVDRLEFVEADLLTPGAFDDAATDCDFIIHTASPYSLNTENPQKDLIDPAVMGTRNVLSAAKKSGSVRRVVLTSSMAAITDEPESDHVLTEEDWNTKSTLDRNAYYLSKTLAEKAGWEFMETEKPKFDLVVINPFLVIGPSIATSINASNQLFVDMLAGTYPGIMNLTWGFVDVRDVADAHIRAMENVKARGRYICAGETVPMRQVVEMMTEAGWAKGHKLPKLGMDCAVGDFTVKLSSYMQPKGVGSYLRTHVGRTPRYDTSKIQNELGMKFRPAKESILDTLEDLAKWKHIAGKQA